MVSTYKTLFSHPNVCVCFDWQRKKARPKTAKSERTAKQLLGELYTDIEYLEKLLRDEGVFIICLHMCKDLVPNSSS